MLYHIIHIYLDVEGEACISIPSAATLQKPPSRASEKWNESHGNRYNYTYNALIFTVESLTTSQDASGVNALGLKSQVTR